MKTVHRLFLGLSAASLLVIAGCRDNPTTNTSSTTGATTPVAPRTDNTAQNMNPTTAENTPSNATATNGTSPQDTSGAMTLSDAQTIQVTHFANVGEIAQAKLAQNKAQNADVKKFAAKMISDHTEADQKGLDLSKKENFTLADSPISASLKATADELTSDMDSKTGAEFDRAYIDAQVKEHQAVLDTLDQKLIPAAHDADVKSYLQDVRKHVAKHLEHAQKLQADLAK